MAEAERNMVHLCNMLNEVLLSNKSLSSRLRSMERKFHSSMATRTIRTIETDATSSQEADWQSGAAISRNSVDSTQKPAISRHEESDAQVDWPFTSRAWQAQIPAFEEQLYCTRVYRHAANRHSWSSFLDGGRSTLAISLNSSLTLGEVSQISVYALPIFARELSNADCYDFGPLHSPMVVPLGERSAYRRKEDCTIESAENIPRLLPPGRTGGQYEVSREVTHVFATSLDISITYASAPIVVVGAREHWLYLGRVPLVVSRCGSFLIRQGEPYRTVVDRCEITLTLS